MPSSSSSGTASPAHAGAAVVRQQQSSPPSFFFSSPRLDREPSTASSSSSDETEIATPPSTLSVSSSNNNSLLTGLAASKNAPRAHYRTTDMLQFEGRDSPRQVWICNKKPSSPLPGYVTPSAEQAQQQLHGLETQDCYFATAGVIHQHAHSTASEERQQPRRPNCLHLGHRPTFVHSETVPDVQALYEEHKRMHHSQAEKVTQTLNQDEVVSSTEETSEEASKKVTEDVAAVKESKSVVNNE